MKAFIKYLGIQLKMDLREKGTLLNFYMVPLLFFFIMGSVFASINPVMKTTLAASMTIFSITMGAVMGTPSPIVNMRESGTLRAYKVNGIPGTAVILVQGLSAFIHLFLVAIIIYAVSPIAFHSTIPQNPWLYFAILIIFLFASIGIGVLIGVTAPGQSFATMLSMVIFMPSLLLSGIMFPSSMLPKPLIWLGYILPATHALQSFDGFAYGTKAQLDPGLSLAVIACIGIVMFILATWQFNSIRKSEQL